MFFDMSFTFLTQQRLALKTTILLICSIGSTFVLKKVSINDRPTAVGTWKYRLPVSCGKVNWMLGIAMALDSTLRCMCSNVLFLSRLHASTTVFVTWVVFNVFDSMCNLMQAYVKVTALDMPLTAGQELHV